MPITRIRWTDVEREQFKQAVLQEYRANPKRTSTAITQEAMKHMKRQRPETSVVTDAHRIIQEHIRAAAAAAPVPSAAPPAPAPEPAAPPEAAPGHDDALSAVETIGTYAGRVIAHALVNALTDPDVKAALRGLALAFLGRDEAKQPTWGGATIIRGPKMLVVGLNDHAANEFRKKYEDRATFVFMPYDHMHYPKLKELCRQCDVCAIYPRGDQRAHQIAKAVAPMVVDLSKGPPANSWWRMDHAIQQFESKRVKELEHAA